MAKQKTVRFKRKLLWNRQHRRCFWCREPIASPDTGSLDHLIPPQLGGPYGYWNIVLACYTCNIARGAQKLGIRRDSRDGWVVWSPFEGNIVVHDRDDPRLPAIIEELHRTEWSRYDDFRTLRRGPQIQPTSIKVIDREWLGIEVTDREHEALWQENHPGPKRKRRAIMERARHD